MLGEMTTAALLFRLRGRDVDFDITKALFAIAPLRRNSSGEVFGSLQSTALG